MENKRIMVAGHICADITPVIPVGRESCDNPFSPGKVLSVKNAEISLGGAVANTGLGLRALGHDAQLVGKISKDMFGDSLYSLLKSWGAEKSIKISLSDNTSYSIILASDNIDRVILHYPGANDTFTSEDIIITEENKPDLLHFGYPPMMKKMMNNNGEELFRLFLSLKKKKITTSLDMCLPDPQSEAGEIDWKAYLKNVLPVTDICIPSIEEAVYMVNRKLYDEIVIKSEGRDFTEYIDLDIISEIGAELLACGVSIVVLKCGKLGYYIRTGSNELFNNSNSTILKKLKNWSGRELFKPAYKVEKVVSTNGAGDTSISGFLCGIVNGLSIENSLRLATALGAECTQSLDAVSSIDTFDVFMDRIKSGYYVNNIINAKHHKWKRNPRNEFYLGLDDSSRRQSPMKSGI